MKKFSLLLGVLFFSHNLFAEPAAPANLAATATSASKIDLSWTASTGAKSYKVQRALDDAFTIEFKDTFADSGKFLPNPTSYRSIYLKNKTYFYRVSACNGSLCSAWSTISATPLNPLVGSIPCVNFSINSDPVACGGSGKCIEVSWDADVSLATGASGLGFAVQRDSAGVFDSVGKTNGYWTGGKVGSTPKSRVDGTYLVSGQTYYYRAYPYSAQGGGAPSATASVTISRPGKVFTIASSTGTCPTIPPNDGGSCNLGGALASSFSCTGDALTNAPFAAGTGVANDPYKICSSQQLAEVHNYLDANFIVMSNIDMSGVSFEPIGTDNNNTFRGTFDGNSYVISNLNFNSGSVSDGGLFGYNSGTIRNVFLENVSITVSGWGNAGGIAGSNLGTIKHSYVTGSVTGANQVGGFVGQNMGTIIDCYSTASVNNTITYGGTGGFVGGQYGGGTITNAYSTGTVQAGDMNYYALGGFSGINYYLEINLTVNTSWDPNTSGMTKVGANDTSTQRPTGQMLNANWNGCNWNTNNGTQYPTLKVTH